MKQTAVEWLISKIEVNSNPSLTQKEMIGYIEQAKEMEKQQIIDCGNTCAIKQHIHIEKVNKMTMDEMLEFANTQTVTFGEQYYSETFKK
jgi:hypothetical protein